MAQGADTRSNAFAIPPTWRVAEALARHPRLGLVPSRTPGLLLEGEVRCLRVGPDDVLIDEWYGVTIDVPPAFPRALPRVVETQGKVPRSFHRHPDGSLCLGSPIALKFAIADEPTLGGFVERALVPYLYSHAFFTRFDRVPFGELAHGVAGLEDDVRRIFRLPHGTDAEEFLRLASLKRRHANKRLCPCRAGARVGRCHAATVHSARRRLGRAGCLTEHLELARQRQAERPGR